MTATGDRFKVLKPNSAKIIGQGDLPDSYRMKQDGDELRLVWGEIIEADENLTDVSAVISGTKYVRADVIESLLSSKNPVVKSTKKAKILED